MDVKGWLSIALGQSLVRGYGPFPITQVWEFQILQCVISSGEGGSVLRPSVAREATVERTRMYLPHALKRYPLFAPRLNSET
jgi:hypothetical protein